MCSLPTITPYRFSKTLFDKNIEPEISEILIYNLGRDFVYNICLRVNFFLC